MKKIIILLLFFCILAGCKNNTIQTYPSSFLTIINKYEYNEDDLNKYYHEFQKTNNIIYAINKVNYPTFLENNNDNYPMLIKPIPLVNKKYYITSSYNQNLIAMPSSIDYIKRDDYPMYINKLIEEPLISLLKDAEDFNYYLTVFSGYRSISYQEQIYNNSKNKTYVALPGYSEHHTGLAIDIATRDTGLTKYFDNTLEYDYLKNNAHRFGFILRYPHDKEEITLYPFESWHYRYVGKKIATIIYENNLTLEEYIYYYELI